jgi:hypothetical protein
MNQEGSKVAHLRAQIETELQAMQQGFSGFATTGKHAIITHKYNAIGRYQEQLALSIGDEEATRYVCEAYVRLVK